MPNAIQIHTKEKIRAQAGIEPTTLGVLAHYSNHRATEALVVERLQFDYNRQFLIFSAVINDHSNYFNKWRSTRDADGFPNWLTGSLEIVYIVRTIASPVRSLAAHPLQKPRIPLYP